MRGSRSLLVLLVLALGLGAYIYFVEMRRTPEDSIVKKDKVFAGLDAAKIDELEIKSAGGDVTKLKKNGGNWQIVGPETADADQTEVGNIVSALGALEITRVVEEKPADAKPFGLDVPRISVTARSAGATPRTLDIGSKTPTGSDLYAKIDGQPRVVLIGASSEDQMNRTTFDLREKAVLKFARDNADSLKLEPAGGPVVTIAKKGSDWRLSAPVDSKADTSTVEGVLSKVSQSKMKAIEKASDPLKPEEAKKFGLDKPQTIATVGVGSTRASLAIGAKKDDGTVYARDLSRPMVFTVESSLVDDLKKTGDDLRSKDVFEFRAFNARSIELTWKGVTYSFAKQMETPKPPETKPGETKPGETKPAQPAKPAQPEKPAEPTEVWKQLKPTAKDPNATAMSDLLTNFSNLRAEKFADKPQTGGDDLVLVAKYGEPSALKEERVTFRKVGAVVQAIRAGEAGAAVITTADFDRAFGNLKDLGGIK